MLFYFVAFKTIFFTFFKASVNLFVHNYQREKPFTTNTQTIVYIHMYACECLQSARLCFALDSLYVYVLYFLYIYYIFYWRAIRRSATKRCDGLFFFFNFCYLLAVWTRRLSINNFIKTFIYIVYYVCILDSWWSFNLNIFT